MASNENGLPNQYLICTDVKAQTVPSVSVRRYILKIIYSDLNQFKSYYIFSFVFVCSFIYFAWVELQHHDLHMKTEGKEKQACCDGANITFKTFFDLFMGTSMQLE